MLTKEYDLKKRNDVLFMKLKDSGRVMLLFSVVPPVLTDATHCATIVDGKMNRKMDTQRCCKSFRFLTITTKKDASAPMPSFCWLV